MRLAVVGAGLIGRAHIAAARARADVRLCAIADPAPAAQALAQDVGVAWHSTLDELLAATAGLDAVVLASPNTHHVQQALACIDAGLAVLVEKPVATTVAEGRVLVDAVRARGARAMVGHHRAHSPIMARAREVVASGELGRIVCISGSSTFLKPDHYFDDGPWRKFKGGGPILINLIHEVHNFRLLCGEIVGVQALASHAVRGFEVEDTVTVNFEFTSGAIGNFLLSDTTASSRNWEHTSHENPAYPQVDDEDCYVISGTRGSLAVPTMRLKTCPKGEAPSWWKPMEHGRVGLVRADPIARQMAHFVAVTRGAAAPIVTVEDGWRNLCVTEAVTRAAETKAYVAVDYT